MTCAFGRSAFDLLVASARHGGHVRTGFENGWQLPDDSIAPDNAALVRAPVPQLRAAGCRPAAPAEARRLPA